MNVKKLMFISLQYFVRGISILRAELGTRHVKRMSQDSICAALDPSVDFHYGQGAGKLLPSRRTLDADSLNR